ncbi:ATP-binding protein [Actinotalea sp.]|uniref:ATP-binding protein n=1 Tax=Actinotalea sp. TaxID=1872145 RepID=UPI002B69307F|nr:ATP-binding protein [Actinotalea sp.]HQY33548.1 ATP-binding protein [Actinotalea sp.]HRA49632.1 ATP-binding protein [Actinotalea sp.]
MTGDRERRTSSGSTLRLVAEATAAAGVVPQPSAPADEHDTSLVLPGQRQSVAVGRHWVVRAVVERGVTGMANQVVELLSSELLANAVLHGPDGGAIGVQVRYSTTVLRVSVSDAGLSTPVVLHNEPSAPNGRGMAIVEAMSSRWGVDEHSDGGKTVWFELDLADF